MLEYTLVYENLEGVASEHHLFNDHKKAEEHFIQCLKENLNPEDNREEVIDEMLNEGFYDDHNGYEIIICQPTLHFKK